MNLSKRNQKNLDLIEKSIMVLNLDDCVALNNDQVKNNREKFKLIKRYLNNFIYS